MAFLCVKLIVLKNGRFTSQHIHDSKAMKRKGIGCVLEQDREARRNSGFAVAESGRNEQSEQKS